MVFYTFYGEVCLIRYFFYGFYSQAGSSGIFDEFVLVSF